MAPTQQQRIQDFFPIARSLSVEAFDKRYAHPFLLGREVLEEEFSFATAIANVEEPQILSKKEGLHIRDWVLPVHKAGSLAAGPVRLFVGRSSNNDLPIPHPTVSKLHAYFSHEDGKWWIVDVGSSNGTTVNGMKAPPRAKTALYDNDVVVFGRCAFSFLTARSLYDLVTRLSAAYEPTVES
jgi:hypothetical protein